MFVCVLHKTILASYLKDYSFLTIEKNIKKKH
nr:MAG TPA: hypothetical protein [Herelleviridae sp.]